MVLRNGIEAELYELASELKAAARAVELFTTLIVVACPATLWPVMFTVKPGARVTVRELLVILVPRPATL